MNTQPSRLFAAVFLALCIISCNKAEKNVSTPDDGSTVYGFVTAGGVGLSGVVVSDGKEVVLTDEDGRYSLKSDKANGSIFVSVPSGYEALSDGVLPLFHFRTSKSPSNKERIDFELKPVDQSEYKMLFFGDMHLADRSFTNDIKQFRRFASEVNSLTADSGTPVYALTLGDMTWDVFWEANGYGFKRYLSEIQKDFSGIQIFHTMGNHDNDPDGRGDAAGSSTYEARIAPNHYSFNAGGVHYIVLDDIIYKNFSASRDYSSGVSEEQLEWLEKDLGYIPRSTPVVVSMHIPLYNKNGNANMTNFTELISYFKDFDYVQFVTGHKHLVYNVDMLDRSVPIYENVSGSVCGSLWMTETACESGMNLCCDGAPGGYRIMDIKGNDIRWTYKGTECPQEQQFRTYDRNSFCLDVNGWVPHASAADQKAFLASVGNYANKSISNQVLINVWDYDPSWSISVKENGKSLTVNQLKNVKDPLYLAVYEAYEYEHGYSVSYPANTTDHIFSVNASSPSSTLEIEVTDRFGRTYSETMLRPKPFYSPK
ncbi:MAG: calcineurin-like phosphoesterase family protein [Bacteroidia bacterium]|nr:calcineurin-like phosphoesterase family protein [Bacteroidia bacterium]